jgi:hypothetical protein
MTESNGTCDLVEIFQNFRWMPSVISFVVLQIITALVAVIANALVILAFVMEKELERRKINVYIISLAIADLLVGIIGIPVGTIVMIWGSQVCL